MCFDVISLRENIITCFSPCNFVCFYPPPPGGPPSLLHHNLLNTCVQTKLFSDFAVVGMIVCSNMSVVGL